MNTNRAMIKWIMPCVLVPFLLTCDEQKQNSTTVPANVLTVDDDAKTVVDKAIKVYGGEKAFSRLNCGYFKYKAKYNVPTPVELGDVIIEDTFQLPGHLKRVNHMYPGGKEVLATYVINHGQCWIKNGDAEPVLTDNNSSEQTAHVFAGFFNLLPLSASDVTLAKIGTEIVLGKEAITIRARSDKLVDVDFFFDVQSGHLVRTHKMGPVPNSTRDCVMEVFLADHKWVQDAQLPTRITSIQDGKTIAEVTILEAKFADKFDESVFAKP